MKVEERRRVYIELTGEEREILHKASTLITSIHDNMNEEDELTLIDEDTIIDSFTRKELRYIAASLLNVSECSLEII